MKPPFLFLCLTILAGGQTLFAGALEIKVRDQKGLPVGNAVVYAQGGNSPARASQQAVIDQRNKQFIPYVTAVQVGTSILFPNRDNIRHHVYSLSPAKRFELPLYAGVPAAPVLFDKEGFVTLGCNIHDWMVAYVAVLSTPYFRVTGADGQAGWRDLPAGKYLVEAWHPLLRGDPAQRAQTIELSNNVAGNLNFTLDLRPDFRARRAPGLSTGGYP